MTQPYVYLGYDVIVPGDLILFMVYRPTASFDYQLGFVIQVTNNRETSQILTLRPSEGLVKTTFFHHIAGSYEKLMVVARARTHGEVVVLTMMKITNGAKVHQLKDTPYGRMVDVTLKHPFTTQDVYWSPVWERPGGGGGRGGCNSYVVYQFEDEVHVASVNGCGEIRWVLHEHDVVMALQLELKTPSPKPWQGDWVEHLGVIKHFGIVVV